MRAAREGRDAHFGVEWGHPRCDIARTVSPSPAMIDLTPADIEEFRLLFKAETGKDITTEQAAAYATNLVRLIAFATGLGEEPSR